MVRIICSAGFQGNNLSGWYKVYSLLLTSFLAFSPALRIAIDIIRFNSFEVGTFPFNCFGSSCVSLYSETPIGFVLVLKVYSTSIWSLVGQRIIPIEGLSSESIITKTRTAVRDFEELLFFFLHT